MPGVRTQHAPEQVFGAEIEALMATAKTAEAVGHKGREYVGGVGVGRSPEGEVRSTHHFEYFPQHGDVVFILEKRPLAEELCKNAAQRPDVHGLAVVLVFQQDFRRLVDLGASRVNLGLF